MSFVSKPVAPAERCENSQSSRRSRGVRRLRARLSLEAPTVHTCASSPGGASTVEQPARPLLPAAQAMKMPAARTTCTGRCGWVGGM